MTPETDPRPIRVSSLHPRCPCRGRDERTTARESHDSWAGSMRRQCRPRESVLLRELRVCPDGLDVDLVLGAFACRGLCEGLEPKTWNPRDVDPEFLGLAEGQGNGVKDFVGERGLMTSKVTVTFVLRELSDWPATTVNVFASFGTRMSTEPSFSVFVSLHLNPLL